MRILSNAGRIVAINHSGKWEALEGVSKEELGDAFHNGTTETVLGEREISKYDIIDFSMTVGICLTVLILATVILSVC
jgi:hypothetical protein